MKVDSASASRAATAARRGDRPSAAKSGEFARHLDDAAQAGVAGGVSAGVGVGGVAGLLSVQASEDALGAPRRAIVRATTLLDRLDELRHGLLMGALSPAQLADLARIVRVSRERITDPGLQAVLDDIDLRAQVELAKLEMNSTRSKS
jgi:hypothetical protein